MRKWIALCLAVLLCLALASCGSDGKKTQSTGTEQATKQTQTSTQQPTQQTTQTSSVTATPATKKTSVTVGGNYTYGSYEQDNNTANGKEPIEWIILDKRDDGSLVLLSKYALDAKPYNVDYTDVTWETCSLRAWLNEDFYNSAFNAEEQTKIVCVTLENEDNPYGLIFEEDTQDKVWLLSINEVTNEFTDDKVYSRFTGNYSRICMPTKYAEEQIARSYYPEEYTRDPDCGCWWWLRSSGTHFGIAAEIDPDGEVSDVGSSVDLESGCVRPAIVIKP